MLTFTYFLQDDCSGDVDTATTHYNTTVLSDLTLTATTQFVDGLLAGSAAIKEAVSLLKVWLHQRQLDIVRCLLYFRLYVGSCFIFFMAYFVGKILLRLGTAVCLGIGLVRKSK